MTNETRTPAEIERRIQQDRADLSDSVNNLQRKFAPDAIVRDVTEMVREQADDLTRNIRQAVGRNPGAVMMMGAGLAWLMINSGRADADRGAKTDARYDRADGRQPKMQPPTAYGTAEDDSWWTRANGSRSTNFGEKSGVLGTIGTAGSAVVGAASNAAAAIKDSAASLGQSLMQGTEDLSEEARARIQSARQAAADARDAAQSTLADGTRAATGFFDDQPLVIGALAVALGAALGSALPRTRLEDQTLGSTSDQLFAEAQAIYREERQKAVAVLKATQQQIKDTAQQTLDSTKSDLAGLVPEGKTAAAVVVDRLAGAAGEVLETARSEAERVGMGKRDA